MRKVVAIVFGALFVAAGSASADAQQANIALRDIGHFGRHTSNAWIGNDTFSAHTQSEEIVNRTCTYIGGPKGTLWACR
jgi:hypothetical protein